jgi:hypothetical protein
MKFIKAPLNKPRTINHFPLRVQFVIYNGVQSDVPEEHVASFRVDEYPWRWRRRVLPKCLLTINGLCGFISQRIELFITSVVTTSNPAFSINVFHELRVYNVYSWRSVSRFPYVSCWCIVRLLMLETSECTVSCCDHVDWIVSESWGLGEGPHSVSS